MAEDFPAAVVVALGPTAEASHAEVVDSVAGCRHDLPRVVATVDTVLRVVVDTVAEAAEPSVDPIVASVIDRVPARGKRVSVVPIVVSGPGPAQEPAERELADPIAVSVIDRVLARDARVSVVPIAASDTVPALEPVLPVSAGLRVASVIDRARGQVLRAWADRRVVSVTDQELERAPLELVDRQVVLGIAPV